MRVWFITGASRGFGALIAETALKSGDAVVATARDPKVVIRRLGARDRLLATRLDVTSEAEAHEAAGQAVKMFGRIDILVNNAGYGLLGAIEEASSAETAKLFDTNVFGLLGVTRAVLPHMRRRRSGHIINISSVGGYTGYPGWGVYGATKFAVEGISEALAGEVAPVGSRSPWLSPASSAPISSTRRRWRAPRSTSTTTAKASATPARTPPTSTTASAAIRASSRARSSHL
jgi:NADP-dependent 3-hydroxy acid dehydrogenase YdfG